MTPRRLRCMEIDQISRRASGGISAPLTGWSGIMGFAEETAGWCLALYHSLSVESKHFGVSCLERVHSMF